MELLIRRNQKGRKYILWAKFELTKEEERIVAQRELDKIVLVPTDVRGDFLRSCIFALPIAIPVSFIIYSIYSPVNPRVDGLEIFLLTLAAIAVIIYKRINKQLIILDLLKGHTFTEKNVAIVATIEQQINEWAELFKGHLEASHAWGGKEVRDV
jgi:hypothetical protein